MGRKPNAILTLNMEGKKVFGMFCRDCGEFKPLSSLVQDRSKPFGVKRICKDPCQKARRKKRYELNKEEEISLSLSWGKNNPERKKVNNKNYRKYNRESDRASRHRRRAREKSLPCFLSISDWASVKLKPFNGMCALSSEIEDITMDHFIPLSIYHGGTYLGNIYPLSFNLNSSKKDANPFEWYERPHIKAQIPTERWTALIKYLAEKNGLTTEDFKDYVYWCFENPRTEEEAKRDTEAGITSLDLWRKATKSLVLV